MSRPSRVLRQDLFRSQTYPHKIAGIVVDYYGIARHLKVALAACSPEDIQGVLRNLTDEIPKLRDRHRRVVDLPRAGRGRVRCRTMPSARMSWPGWVGGCGCRRCLLGHSHPELRRDLIYFFLEGGRSHEGGQGSYG